MDLYISEQIQDVVNPAIPIGCDALLTGVDESIEVLPTSGPWTIRVQVCEQWLLGMV